MNTPVWRGLAQTGVFNSINEYLKLQKVYENHNRDVSVLAVHTGAVCYNIALDVLLVGVLHAGIWGVAVATVLCQIVSAGCFSLHIGRKLCPKDI